MDRKAMGQYFLDDRGWAEARRGPLNGRPVFYSSHFPANDPHCSLASSSLWASRGSGGYPGSPISSYTVPIGFSLHKSDKQPFD